MAKLDATIQQENAINETRMKADELDFYSLLRRQGSEGRLFFNQQRSVIFNTEAIAALRHQLMMTLGQDVARSILARFGYTQGYQDAARLNETFDWETENDWLTAGFSLHTLAGVALITVDQLQFDRVTGNFFVRAVCRNSYEAEEYIKRYGLTDSGICWILTGYISGYATNFFKQELLAIEVECAGKGDERCCFEIRSIDEWGSKAGPYLAMLQETNISEQLETTQRYQEQTRQLTLLNELSSELNLAKTVDDVLKVVASKTQQIIGGDQISVALFNTSSDNFDLFVLDSAKKTMIGGASLPVDGSAIGKAAQENKVIITPNLQTSEFVEHKQLVEVGLRSVINMPLVVGGKIVGTLNVGSNTLNFYGLHDENILLQISSLLAGAIENRRLFEQAQKRAHREQILRKVTNQVRSSVNVDAVLRTAAQEIGHMLDRPAFAYLGETSDQTEEDA